MTSSAYSLRLNLLKLVMVPLAVGSLLVWGLGIFFIYDEVDEVYDATLVQFSRTLAHLTENDVREYNDRETVLVSKNDILAHKYERKISFRIMKNAAVIAQSPNAEQFRMLSAPAGFSDQFIGGKKWRFFTFVDETTHMRTEVGEKYQIRHELTGQLLSSLIFPAILFAAAVLMIVWWGTTKSLQQLVNLSVQVDRRDANDLTPIEDTSIPREIQPLLRALNRLFLRVDDSLQREKEFTDNAAHELRTPLAAMKMQAQVLLKSETLSKNGKEGFENLLAAIDRSIDMTESLLSFSRLQTDQYVFEQSDLSKILHTEIQNLEKTPGYKARQVLVRAEENVIITGVPYALSILMRNIIQNALKFTPEKGEIIIRSRKNGNLCLFEVIDTGHGIDDELKKKVFERFFRAGKSAAPGSGIGLAMAKWIADLHHADIRLSDNKPHGLAVTVSFAAL